MRRFPSFYPEDCPDGELRLDEVVAYRLVEHDPPQRSDFLAYCEEPYNRGKVFRGQKLCEACGTSLYEKKSDVLAAKKMFNTLRHKKLARGVVSGVHGPWRYTPRNGNSHITWWIYLDGNPHLSFEVCSDE